MPGDAWLRFMNWPLRVKMAALLVVASLLPLATAAYIENREAKRLLLANTAALLAARGDQLAGNLDTFHSGNQRSVDRLARLPEVTALCQSGPDAADRLKPALRAVLDVELASDENVRGVAILDASGTVRIATEGPLVGLDLSHYRYVRDALRGAAVISDIHVAGPEVGSALTIAYLAPVRALDRRTIALAALWVKASSLWDIAKASNELAGPGSFAVLFDHQGVRIAHTYSRDIVFHPGGPLDPATVDALVAERRFGENTRALLEDVRAFPEQFDRARSASPDPGLFRGFAPVNQKWNYGVGRRLETVPWTLFYMIPEASLNARIAELTRQESALASLIILVALVTGTAFAAVILKPIRSLTTATESIAGGDLAARAQGGHTDEIGRLGRSFNSMADRIQAQAATLQGAHDELELRVRQRTADLRESEQNLATTLDSIGDAVIATDVQGDVVRMNPVAEQLTGWALGEARGRPLAEVFRILDEETQQPVENPVVRVLREGLVVGLANHTVLISRDGSRRPIADSGAPIRGSEGEIRGVVLVFRDQTEERKSEEMRLKSAHLEEHSLRAHEANRLKSEFLANMSHELRTPLNAIIGFSELIHDGKAGAVTPDQKEYLGDILASSQHLLQLINDVLDLSKVESGKMEFRSEPIDLMKLTTEVGDILRTLAAKKRIAIQMRIDASLSGIVTDPSKLKQVLYNYLSNALKFTPEEGRVELRVLPEGEDLFRVEVEDTGIGIAPSAIPKLFVEFQQLDASAAKKYPGTGLGLALTKRIVEAQGGRVGVESCPGEGSVFFAVLPRTAVARPPPAEAASTALPEVEHGR